MGELDYLGLYGKDTRVVFRSRIIAFLKVIYPTETVKTANVNEFAKRYFTETRNYKQDINTFGIAIRESPPISRRNYLTTIRKFLEQNERELPSVFWKNLLNTITGEAVTQDKVPTNSQLKQLLMNMPVGARALYSILASSGMRIGEAMALTDHDIDLTSNPVKINIPPGITKTKKARITFITAESKGFLDEWLAVRTNGERLFSFTKSEAGTYWANACKQCKLDQRDPVTHRLLYHPHSLRKYFRTKGGKINRDAVEKLLGHRGLANDPAYLRLEEEDLVKFYHDLEPLITVFTIYDEKLPEKEARVKKLENYEVKFEDYERKLGALRQIVNEIAAKVGIS